MSSQREGTCLDTILKNEVKPNQPKFCTTEASENTPAKMDWFHLKLFHE
jgi:hypothetical protein